MSQVDITKKDLKTLIKVYNWCMDNPNNINGKLAYAIKRFFNDRLDEKFKSMGLEI